MTTLVTISFHYKPYYYFNQLICTVLHHHGLVLQRFGLHLLLLLLEPPVDCLSWYYMPIVKSIISTAGTFTNTQRPPAHCSNRHFI